MNAVGPAIALSTIVEHPKHVSKLRYFCTVINIVAELTTPIVPNGNGEVFEMMEITNVPPTPSQCAFCQP